MDRFNNWLENLKTHWINKDIDSIMDMFDNSAKYFETPFQEIVGYSSIRNAWHEIDEQNIENLTYELLGIKDDTVIANYILYLSNNEVINMVYQIELNKNNKCIYFKQWFMQKK